MPSSPQTRGAARKGPNGCHAGSAPPNSSAMTDVSESANVVTNRSPTGSYTPPAPYAPFGAALEVASTSHAGGPERFRTPAWRSQQNGETPPKKTSRSRLGSTTMLAPPWGVGADPVGESCLQAGVPDRVSSHRSPSPLPSLLKPPNSSTRSRSES